MKPGTGRPSTPPWSDLFIFTPPRRLNNFSAPQILVLFFVLALVAIIPILTHQLPPLEDYVNHLARMHVIATSGHASNAAIRPACG